MLETNSCGEIGSVDLVPSPRVLRMLGNIEYENWQCLAELIDNSIDALLPEGGGNIGIITPSRTEFDNNPAATVRVWDDGPGMSPEQLEKALKAGYSSNDPLSHLGLFGMGFNIATARLGKTTQVMTTRKGDEYWTSVTIDFKEMEESGNYERPLFGRKKDNPEIHGTQVIISGLYERVRTIRNQYTIKKTLSRIYSPILQNDEIRINIDDDELSSRGHCVWGKDRYVIRSGDRIPAYIEIDENFGKEYYCKNCWEWIENVPVQDDINAIVCPECGSSTEIIAKERRLKGWLGVQRHYDPDHYGIDLIRNGRVIEPLCKDFFYWTNPETGERKQEYVLDATYLGGRIVGELNIDFVPVTYMKDHFEKANKKWKEVEKCVRGPGPLRPKHAKEAGYPENTSPLGIIYKGYRKANEVGKGDLYPGDEHGNGINKMLKDWAERYYEGDPEYQDDHKWWELVEVAEKAKRTSDGKPTSIPTPSKPTINPTGTTKTPDVKIVDVDTDPEEDDNDEESGDDLEYQEEEKIQIEKDLVLSQTYEIDDLKEPGIDVTVNKMKNGDLNGLPIELEVKSKDTFEFTIDPNHPIFTGFNVGPIDLILLELSQKLSQRKDDPQEWPTSRVFSLLKEKYSADKKLSPSYLAEQATSMISSIKKYIAAKKVPVEGSVLDDDTVNEVRKNLFSRLAGGEKEVQDLLKTTEYINHAPDEEIRKLFNRMPEIFLDGGYWDIPYENLGNNSLKKEAIRTFSSYIDDILWLKKEARDYNPEIMPPEVEYRLQRASYSLKLLEGHHE